MVCAIMWSCVLVLNKMASAVLSVAALASPCTRMMDTKKATSFKSLSSFASVSSSSLQTRRNLVLHKKCSLKVRAMAKELHFNKDGSAIKKLQVCWRNKSYFFGIVLLLY